VRKSISNPQGLDLTSKQKKPQTGDCNYQSTQNKKWI